MSFRPQFVTDESMNPVAVIIPYKEWLKINKKLGLTVDESGGRTAPEAKTKVEGEDFLQPLAKASSKIERMASDARKAHREGKTRKFPA